MIEFFFDCSSPWTYLAFHNLLPMAAELGFDDRLAADPGRRRVQRGQSQRLRIRARSRCRRRPPTCKKDLAGLGAHLGIEIVFPPTVFPVNSVKAMRGCILLEPEGKLVPFARAAFEAYWGDDEDISQDDVLREICGKAGVDADEVLRRDRAAADQGQAARQHRGTDATAAGSARPPCSSAATTCISATTACRWSARPWSGRASGRQPNSLA